METLENKDHKDLKDPKAQEVPVEQVGKMVHQDKLVYQE